MEDKTKRVSERENTRITRTFNQFFKFGITGALGTLTNLLLFFIFVDKMHLPETPVSVGCFLISGTQNYIINHKYTFLSNTGTSALTIKKWLAFLSASLVGLIINLIVMKLVVFNFTLPYKFIAQACGIVAGMFVNFWGLKLFVFRKG